MGSANSTMGLLWGTHGELLLKNFIVVKSMQSWNSNKMFGKTTEKCLSGSDTCHVSLRIQVQVHISV